jgi:stage II sporulation protein D
VIAAVLALALLAAPAEIKVRLTQPDGGRIVVLPLERYVAGVLGGESGVFRSKEALKAQAVAARTYALRLRGRHSSEGFDFCATTHCQRVDLRAVTPRLQSAADETAGELLWFEGKLAFASYSGDCGGRTEDARAVWPDLAAPYLISHPDPYCTRAGVSAWRWLATGPEIAAALVRSQLRAPRNIERIVVASRTAAGRARTLTLSGGSEQVQISAGSFRLALGRGIGWDTLRNDLYDVALRNGRFVFEGSGAGHGVGLCQRGADQMGVDGRSYREILAFYYPGTSIGLTARGFPWLRFGGESIAVLATQADWGRAVLADSERLSRALSERTRLKLPVNTEILVYPDMDAFRNATGEPGWVAAHTVGARIHLQPASVLRNRGALESTLRHELLHVLIENRARPGLPVWFREGLAEYFEHPASATASSAMPDEIGIRQTDDAARARQANADAVRRVTALVKRFGEAAVLTWLDRGLPPEAK